MQRKSVHALTLIIVAALAACAGYVAGSRVGVRECTSLKAQNATLSANGMRMSERLAEAETTSEDLAGHLDHAHSEMDRLSAAADLPTGAVERDERSTPALHPPMITDLDRTEAENRIAELECEVASLKEWVNSNSAMPLEGPPAKSSPASTVLAKSVASPATKEQCSAITQKGVRCSRQARSSGKCWQHGG